MGLLKERDFIIWLLLYLIYITTERVDWLIITLSYGIHVVFMGSIDVYRYISEWRRSKKRKSMSQ